MPVDAAAGLRPSSALGTKALGDAATEVCTQRRAMPLPSQEKRSAVEHVRRATAGEVTGAAKQVPSDADPAASSQARCFISHCLAEATPACGPLTIPPLAPAAVLGCAPVALLPARVTRRTGNPRGVAR